MTNFMGMQKCLCGFCFIIIIYWCF